MKVVTLASHENLLIESCELLNSEWPRSMGCREHSQRKSCRESPPMSFLLLDSDEKLIGHARICKLPNRPSALWIESVMIKKDRRGQGLGKFLMFEVENFMRKHRFDEAFLSTEDQCGFYESIGYQKCDPIVHSTTATCVFAAMDHFQNAAAANPSRSASSVSNGTASNSSSTSSESAPPPPPPPPVPKMVTRSTSPIVASSSTIDVNTTDHQYMRKSIHP
ncbi:unnamed protein product [Caenorhabditis nigoni]